MASAADIDAVQLQVPDEAEEFGYTEAAISSLLDSGLTQFGTILTVLRGISSKAASFEDISESGSSRSSRFFDNLKALIDYWQGLVDKETLEATGSKPKEAARIWTSVRV